jgi:hypothetical protein
MRRLIQLVPRLARRLDRSSNDGLRLVASGMG